MSVAEHTLGAISCCNQYIDWIMVMQRRAHTRRNDGDKVDILIAIVDYSPVSRMLW